MTTLSFTPSQECIISLQEFKEKSFNFVSICVGLNETFELDSKSNLSTNNPSNIPTNDPKFILYAFKEITGNHLFCSSFLNAYDDDFKYSVTFVHQKRQ